VLHIPLDRSVEILPDVPYTYSYIIRKRQQIDNLNELPKDKRPPDSVIWGGTPEELDEWIEKVFDNKKKHSEVAELVIDEVEG
jgi:hypothetical protein